MHCPYCRGETRVIDSRDADNGSAIRRRRECAGCKRRVTTFERLEDLPLLVRKREGTIEPFDRAKVVSGIVKACKNRPVSDVDAIRITDEVEEVCREAGAEIESDLIGREVLVRLKELDEVAYVRFASVYRDFQEVAEFERVIKELGAPEDRPSGVSRRK